MSYAVRLRIVSLFEDLSVDELSRVAELCSLHRYEKQAQILDENESTSDVFFVLAGSVRISSYALSGREINYRDASIGGIFGEFAAVDRLPRSASVVALSDCTLARMSSASFTGLLQNNGRVALRLIETLVSKIRGMSERVFEVSALGIRERVRKELLRLAAQGLSAPPGVLIKPAPTHYEIAARIGSHREAVTREFNRLEDTGIIEVRRQEIRIKDVRRLEALEEA